MVLGCRVSCSCTAVDVVDRAWKFIQSRYIARKRSHLGQEILSFINFRVFVIAVSFISCVVYNPMASKFSESLYYVIIIKYPQKPSSQNNMATLTNLHHSITECYPSMEDSDSKWASVQ